VGRVLRELLSLTAAKNEVKDFYGFEDENGIGMIAKNRENKLTWVVEFPILYP
jgi:hypothetical protein